MAPPSAASPSSDTLSSATDTSSSDDPNSTSQFVFMPRVSQPEPNSVSVPIPTTSKPNPQSNSPKPHVCKSNSTHTSSKPNSESNSLSLPEPHVSKSDSKPNPESKSGSLPVCCVIALEAVSHKSKITDFSNKGPMRKKAKKDSDNGVSASKIVTNFIDGGKKVEVGDEDIKGVECSNIQLSALCEFGNVDKEFMYQGFQLLSQEERNELEKEWRDLKIAQMEATVKRCELYKSTAKTVFNALNIPKRY